MKKFSQILLLIYLNFWYIPLLAFLIGIKICLVSFLVTSIQPRDRGLSFSHSSSSNLWGQVLTDSNLSKVARSINSIKKEQNSIDAKKLLRTTSIPQQVLEEWAILGNLLESHIRPTHSNRTEAESIWLIFNRIPRCGGTTLVKLLEKLTETNGFSHQAHEYRTPWPRFLLEQEQESLVTWFEYQHLPKSYDRHFFFVNFTKYQKYVKQKPIYVNMMRDPVLRIRSDYFARRADKDLAHLEIRRRDKQLPGSGLQWYKRDFEECVLQEDEECQFETGTPDFTLTVPFFCGQHNACVVINDKWGLQMAKFTIEKHYSVVGVVERMDQTLAVLENYVPKFFSGATQFYKHLDADAKHSNRNQVNARLVSAAARRTLEHKLYAEVDLYRFVSQRLALQHSHLAGTY